MSEFKVGDKVWFKGDEWKHPQEVTVTGSHSYSDPCEDGPYEYDIRLSRPEYKNGDSDNGEWWANPDELEPLRAPASEPGLLHSSPYLKVYETQAHAEAAQRKARPIVRGFLDYFPDAVLLVEEHFNEHCHDSEQYTDYDDPDNDPTAKWLLGALAERDDTEALRDIAATILADADVERRGGPTDGEPDSFLEDFGETLMEVAHISHVGNEQHHPGGNLYWEFGRSTDHADCLVRHFLQRGTVDSDGCRHIYKAVWRAFAMLQTALEKQDPDLHETREAQRQAAKEGRRV